MSEPSESSTASTMNQAKSAFPFAKSRIPRRQAIALISDHSDPAVEIMEESDGQSVYVRAVGEALAKLGWQVDMFTRKTHPSEATIVQHSPHCRTIRLTAGPEAFLPKDQHFQSMPEFVEAFLKFQTKDGANYPLVHTNYWTSGWVGLQLKERCNVQWVHTYHSVGAAVYETADSLSTLAAERLLVERQILEQAHCTVAITPQEQEQLRSLVSEQGCIEMIPGGTDTENFHFIPKSEARTKLGLLASEQVVLCVGRFEPRKGIETLVRAVAQIKADSEDVPSNLRLLIVGGSDPEHSDGQELGRIERLVQELGIGEQTVFVGWVRHDMLPLYYTAADVCVIPSDYEPFGLVAIEAMACGTPVVASAVGGLKFTVVPDETGLLVPPRDVDAFANAIHRVLTDEVWAKKLTRQASTRVQETFTWTGIAAQLSNLYRQLFAQSLTQAPVERSLPRSAVVAPLAEPVRALPA
ncbi:MAG: glycosyltransferase family 1 protein [Leptolyngbyaceae cyanobacterium SL_7_1]|nr:glycosyltransferase family 1 protein [Leptolyngbyaceae cyanobacterium SL_7_1]